MFTTTTIPTRPRSARRPSAADAALNPWLLWRIDTPREREVLSVAELAECHCPDLCNRDHENE